MILIFGVNEFVAPRFAKILFPLTGTWPIKGTITEARFFEEQRIKFTYLVKTRSFTVTEQHNPRIFEITLELRFVAAEIFFKPIRKPSMVENKNLISYSRRIPAFVGQLSRAFREMNVLPYLFG